MTAATALAEKDCYLALKARDARFDGSFFTGVTSTGIYCRPVCRVKTPKRENCRFYRHAAQAEHAGFRPCLRCRPELAPHLAPYSAPHLAWWSAQDASSILAHQAARLLDAPEAWPDGPPSMARLAARLGVSDRHVRRIFEAQFGVSPLQYLQTRRLHTAKQLLTDTRLPVTQIALTSGYASVRRFNAEFAAHYQLNPTQLRRHLQDGSASTGAGATVRLGFRPPYDVAAMLGFFSRRCIAPMESVAADAQPASLTRTLQVEMGGTVHAGWLVATFDEARCQLVLRVSDSLCGALPLVIRRVRACFDLDADPAAINSVLHASFPEGDGMRVPGALDGYELAVRAVLGQQITVAAARTLAHRLVAQFGDTVATPWPALTRLFPSARALACASPEALGQLGIVRQRQAAITGIARAVADQQLQLHGGADLQATVQRLKDIPGIGDWTAQYIAMRALRWPDAFLAADVALHKALGVQALKNPAREAEQRSGAWAPWRSYAVVRAWSGLLRPSPPSLAPMPQYTPGERHEI